MSLKRIAFDSMIIIWITLALPIRLSADTGFRVLDADADKVNKPGCPVKLWDSNGGDQQRWRLVDQGGGWMRIENKAGGKVLDADADKLNQDGCPVKLWDWNGGNQQQWRVVDQGGGWSIIVNKASGKVLDADANWIERNGSIIKLWGSHGGTNQQWMLHPEKDGFVTIHNKASHNQVVNSVLNFFLYCDKRNDNILEGTDEVYLVGNFVGPRDSKGFFHVGPNDFRDGGDKERRKIYLNLTNCILYPGESVNGSLTVMEDDGNFQQVINHVNDTLKGVKSNNNKENNIIIIIKDVLQIIAALGKGKDDMLAGFKFEIKNEGGTLKMTVQSDGPDIFLDPPNQPITEFSFYGGNPILLHSFRVKHDCSYHAMMWEGFPKN